MTENGKVRFFDKFGRVVIEPRFDFADRFAGDEVAPITRCCVFEKSFVLIRNPGIFSRHL